MKRITMCLLLLFLGGLIAPADAYTIWHSPLTFTTAEPSLTIEPSSPSTTIRVTTDTPGDLQWIDLGLVLPSNVQVDSITICYELRDSNSFISQVRLGQLTTPDFDIVIWDDPTDLTDVGPTCYTSNKGFFTPEATTTLSLRLNYADTGHWIDIGGIGVHVSEMTSAAEFPEDGARAPSLRPSYPNPASPGTTIEFDLESSARVDLRIFDASGRLVRTLMQSDRLSGRQRVVWDGRDDSGGRVAAGTYFYELRADGRAVGTQRTVILR